jgi:hypothetical protein
MAVFEKGDYCRERASEEGKRTQSRGPLLCDFLFAGAEDTNDGGQE